MFVEEIRRAVQVYQWRRLPELSAAVWRGFAAGAIPEDEAQRLAELIEARKAASSHPQMGATAPRRVGSRPRSSASLERRRSWAASSWLPPRLASQFTQAEAAALGVILSEIAPARPVRAMPRRRRGSGRYIGSLREKGSHAGPQARSAAYRRTTCKPLPQFAERGDDRLGRAGDMGRNTRSRASCSTTTGGEGSR